LVVDGNPVGKVAMTESQVTERVIQAVIRVHQSLGPGFLERIYHQAMRVELDRQGLSVEYEREVEIFYEGHSVGAHRLDLVVEGRVIVELKTVEELTGPHYAQLRSYLRATGLSVGLLVNFAKDKADYRRVELSPA
jgi:GxxExxY protein